MIGGGYYISGIDVVETGPRGEAEARPRAQWNVTIPSTGRLAAQYQGLSPFGDNRGTMIMRSAGAAGWRSGTTPARSISSEDGQSQRMNVYDYERKYELQGRG